MTDLKSSSTFWRLSRKAGWMSSVRYAREMVDSRTVRGLRE